jgi:peptidyl-prolyl cis-trans isomerase C
VPGAWAGPIESGYGWHLVWVDVLTPARVPAFAEVEREVRTAWVEDQREDTREKAFEAMRKRYEVVLPKDLDVAPLVASPAAGIPPLAAVAPE